jgi:integrase
MGQLRKRGKVWWIRYYRNGERFEESARTSIYKEARDLLNTKEGARAAGVPIAPQKHTFEDAVVDITADYTNNGRKSLAWVTRRIEKHLKPWFSGRRMGDIRTTDVRAYTAARLTAKASHAEVNRELAILRRMFSLALLDEKLLRAPKIPMLKERNVRSGFFDEAQFQAVRAHLPEALRPLATFAHVTGWRRTEILKLEWRQVDLKAGEIRLDAGGTKNDEGRVIPFDLHDELRETFETLYAEHQALRTRGVICPTVFNRKGKRIADFRGAWTAACTAAGCPGRLLHDFRRSAARNLVRRGVSEGVAMQITGHKTRSVFERYNITSKSDVRDALRKMSDGDNSQGQSAVSGALAAKRSA